MKYVPPFGSGDENAPYVDGSPEHGIEGSVVPAECVEHPQLEIVEVIKQAGLVPSGEDLQQLYEAIGRIIGIKAPNATHNRYGLVKPDGVTTYITTEGGLLAASPDMPWRPLENYRAPCLRLGSDGKVYLWKKASGPAISGVGAKNPTVAANATYWLDYAASITPPPAEKYDLAQYYWFEDEMPRTGLFSCLGGIVPNFAKTYPKAAAYFETEHGKKRLVEQAKYDELHVYVWHTNADGTKVGWNGIGGVNKFVWDKQADTLRLPDLAGMTPEHFGYDPLGVGGVMGDRVRDAISKFFAAGASFGTQPTGPFVGGSSQTSGVADTWGMAITGFDLGRVMPTGPRNHGPRWISDARVYLGQPVL